VRNLHVFAAGLTADELIYLKLLFNEYVQLAWFLLSSSMIDPCLRILIIFPRINFFKVLHEANPAIPPDEPQTLRDIGMLHDRLFSIPVHESKKEKKSGRISERVIQEKTAEALRLFARNILKNVYKPLTDIRRALLYYARKDYGDRQQLVSIKSSIDRMSAYLKKLQQMRRFATDPATGMFDLDASTVDSSDSGKVNALEEIVRNVQSAEVDQTRKVIATKMLDYLSFLTVRLEQTERVSSQYIKQEVVKEMEVYTLSILSQANSYYRLIMGKQGRIYR